MRIATYNVHNLFSEEQAARAGAVGKTAAELNALAGTLAALRADVVLLQEVGSVDMLVALNDRLPSPFPYLEVLPGNSERDIHLAFLSRERFRLCSHRHLLLTDESGAALEEYTRLEDAEAGHAAPLRIQRDLLLAEVLFEGEVGLALFNVHLKSKTNRDWRLLAADVIRSAECRKIAEVVDAYLRQHPDRPVVLGGDFNDTRGSNVLKPLFDLPLSDPLGERLARDGRNPSTYWPKRRMRLDYLLLSEAARALLKSGSEAIHASQRARRASDHYPVSLDLSWEEM